MATTSPPCVTQFDLMMQIASKYDGPGQIFDAPVKKNARVPTNNFLFETAYIGGNEDAKSNATGASGSEYKDEATGAEVTVSPLKVKQDFIKERLRQMQRVWGAMTKFITSQCDNGRTVDLPLAGRFKR